MTADAPEPDSVVTTAADVLAEHGASDLSMTAGGDLIIECGCHEDFTPLEHAAHQAEQLDAAGLLRPDGIPQRHGPHQPAWKTQ